MERKLGNARSRCDVRDGRNTLDLDSLLHPALAFEHPTNVVNDPDLTLNEKRAILASWASDACAVEAAPALRRAPGARSPVRFDEVMEALRLLDRQAQAQRDDSARYRRVLRRARFAHRSDRSDGDRGEGQPLN
jgi:hypothetical protein